VPGGIGFGRSGHVLSSRGMRGRRRMVAQLCDKFKCLKGLTLPCVCTYLQYGWTPLYWAAENGHIEVVRHLVSSGADVNKAIKVSVRLHWLW
jgi:ankyrin repeat protein